MKRNRNEFSARVKVDAFALARGLCQKCGAYLTVGNVHYDHIIPCGLDSDGGDNSLGNCQCICKTCHTRKTSRDDLPRIAKAKRVQRRYAGIKRERSIRAWRRFDGSPVIAPRWR